MSKPQFKIKNPELAELLKNHPLIQSLVIPKPVFERMHFYPRFLHELLGVGPDCTPYEGQECYGFLLRDLRRTPEGIDGIHFHPLNHQGVLMGSSGGEISRLEPNGGYIDFTTQDLIGIWHSHGGHNTFFSGTDEYNLANSTYEYALNDRLPQLRIGGHTIHYCWNPVVNAKTDLPYTVLTLVDFPQDRTRRSEVSRNAVELITVPDIVLLEHEKEPNPNLEGIVLELLEKCNVPNPRNRNSLIPLKEIARHLSPAEIRNIGENVLERLGKFKLPTLHAGNSSVQQHSRGYYIQSQPSSPIDRIVHSQQPAQGHTTVLEYLHINQDLGLVIFANAGDVSRKIGDALKHDLESYLSSKMPNSPEEVHERLNAAILPTYSAMGSDFSLSGQGLLAAIFHNRYLTYASVGGASIHGLHADGTITIMPSDPSTIIPGTPHSPNLVGGSVPLNEYGRFLVGSRWLQEPFLEPQIAIGLRSPTLAHAISHYRDLWRTRPQLTITELSLALLTPTQIVAPPPSPPPKDQESESLGRLLELQQDLDSSLRPNPDSRSVFLSPHSNAAGVFYDGTQGIFVVAHPPASAPTGTSTLAAKMFGALLNDVRYKKPEAFTLPGAFAHLSRNMLRYVQEQINPFSPSHTYSFGGAVRFQEQLYVFPGEGITIYSLQGMNAYQLPPDTISIFPADTHSPLLFTTTNLPPEHLETLLANPGNFEKNARTLQLGASFIVLPEKTDEPLTLSQSSSEEQKRAYGKLESTLHSAEGEARDAQKRADGLAEQVTALIKDRDAALDRVSRAEQVADEIPDLRKRYDTTASDNVVKEKRITDLEAQLRDRDAQILDFGKHQRVYEDTFTERDELRGEVRDLSGRLSGAEARIRAYEQGEVQPTEVIDFQAYKERMEEILGRYRTCIRAIFDAMGITQNTLREDLEVSTARVADLEESALVSGQVMSYFQARQWRWRNAFDVYRRKFALKWEQAEGENARLRTDLDAANARLATLEEHVCIDNPDLREDHATLQQAHAILQAEYDAARQAHSDLQSQYDTVRKDHAVALEENTNLKERIAQLESPAPPLPDPEPLPTEDPLLQFPTYIRPPKVREEYRRERVFDQQVSVTDINRAIARSDWGTAIPELVSLLQLDQPADARMASLSGYAAAKAYNALGTHLAMTGAHEPAKAMFTHALNLAPDYRVAAFNLRVLEGRMARAPAYQLVA